MRIGTCASDQARQAIGVSRAEEGDRIAVHGAFLEPRWSPIEHSASSRSLDQKSHESGNPTGSGFAFRRDSPNLSVSSSKRCGGQRDTRPEEAARGAEDPMRRCVLQMERRICGYHQDDEYHWVAELDCGHDQHVRHDPPWQVREWVTTPAGRAEHLGTSLSCRLCDEGRPPAREPQPAQGDRG